MTARGVTSSPIALCHRDGTSSTRTCPPSLGVAGASKQAITPSSRRRMDERRTPALQAKHPAASFSCVALTLPVFGWKYTHKCVKGRGRQTILSRVGRVLVFDWLALRAGFFRLFWLVVCVDFPSSATPLTANEQGNPVVPAVWLTDPTFDTVLCYSAAAARCS